MPHRDPESRTRYWKERYARSADAQKARAKKWREENRERANEISRRWREQNPERRKQVQRDSYHRRKEKYSAYRRLRRTGATPELYAALLEQQKGLCAICGVRPSKRVLQADHCHESGRVRGLLCSKCNPALGLFLESPEILRRAIEYLEGAN